MSESPQREPRRRPARGVRGAVIALLIAAALASPAVGVETWNMSVGASVLLLGMAATAINLMLGYCGLLTLGAALFLGTGAYGEALAARYLHWSLVPCAIAAIAFSLALAVALGPLLVRLPRFYFAVATLGLSVAFEGVMAALPGVTGGSSGLANTAGFSLGFATVTSATAWYVLLLVVAAGVLLVVHRITAGRPGRLLTLVKTDELAASALGVAVGRSKLVVFVVASGILALAGALLFPLQSVIVPDQTGLTQSVQLLGMAAVGGLGYVEGGFIGAAVLTWVQMEMSEFGNYELLIYGAVFLAVVFFLRPGIAGSLRWLWRRAWDRVEMATPGGEAGHGPAPAAEPPGIAARREARGATAGARGDGLVVRDAVRRFGGVTAVDGVSLSVPRGAITGLIGANGAGKSTLLNLISGIEPLESGAVLLDGDEITGLTPARRARRGMARTFQTPRLVEEMTVVENVMLGPEAATGTTFRRSRAEERSARQAARSALEGAGLDALAQRPAGSLGSGERKFVELLRAVASAPTVLLMDEPGVGLSTAELERLRAWIVDLAGAGNAVLLVDHNMDFIGSLVDHVYVMTRGAVSERRRPADIGIVAGAPASARERVQAP